MLGEDRPVRRPPRFVSRRKADTPEKVTILIGLALIVWLGATIFLKLRAPRRPPLANPTPTVMSIATAPTATPTVAPTPAAPPKAATPSAAPGGQYTVVAGDSLWEIARRNKTTVEALKATNNLKDNTIRVGQVLKIPPPS